MDRGVEAIRWYIAAGNQGNEEAMKNLAKMYECGAGTQVDLLQSCYWMKKLLESSKSGEPSVQNFMHSYGWYLLGAKTPAGRAQQRLPEDMTDADEGPSWLEKAGEAGHVDAVSQLANLYMTNQHPKVAQNVDKGIYWFKKGAELGNGKNAFQLAMLYKGGFVKANPELERKWLEVAARLGYREAVAMLANGQRQSSMSSNKIGKKINRMERESSIEELLGTDESTQCSNPACRKQEASDRFASCSKCHSVKYCSKKCQHAHYYAGHKVDCKSFQKTKEKLKEINLNRLLPLVECFNPECNRRQEGDEKFSQCSKCKHAKYCSRECQKVHWQSGHRNACGKISKETNEATELLEKLSKK